MTQCLFVRIAVVAESHARSRANAFKRSQLVSVLYAGNTTVQRGFWVLLVVLLLADSYTASKVLIA